MRGFVVVIELNGLEGSLEFNRWWSEQPGERYWLEVTDRGDLGVDLNAPQTGKHGKEVWHYSLLNEVADGDIVFHYHKQDGEGAISAWSRASGNQWEDVVLVGSTRRVLARDNGGFGGLACMAGGF